MNSLRDCTLLYVEDDSALRKEMTAFLAIYCRQVVAAASGHEALEKVERGDIDLVLTDIRMPKMDGLDLAERLKQRSSELPVVLYTAFTDVQTLIRGIELGVAGFVQKPTDAKQLIATLEKAVLPVLQRRRIAELSRELQNAVTRLAIAGGAVIGALDGGDTSRQAISSPAKEALPLTMNAVEKWALQRALTAANGKKMVAARLLGMNYYTFRRHLARHGFDSTAES